MYQIVLILIVAGLTAADQLIKTAVIQQLCPNGHFLLWDGVLEFCYTENYGIAWGMMQNSRWPVAVLTAVVVVFLLGVLLSGRFKHSRLVSIGGALVIAGGLGNLLDRVLRGFVVDFIHYYKWFDFPVFNVADMCITVGAVLILIYFFFFGSKEAPKEEPHGTPLSDGDSTTGGSAD